MSLQFTLENVNSVATSLHYSLCRAVVQWLGKVCYAKLLQNVHVIHLKVACKRTDVSVTTLLLAVSVGFVGEVVLLHF